VLTADRITEVITSRPTRPQKKRDTITITVKIPGADIDKLSCPRQGSIKESWQDFLDQNQIITERLSFHKQTRLLQAYLTISAWLSGLASRNITPGMQIASWLEQGIAQLEQNRSLSIADIEASMLMGGTDHPDPYFT
jgi:hypothetical protein